MKYRVKIITYLSGRKLYFAQVKKGVLWANLMNDGGIDYVFPSSCYSRDEALKCIDKNYSGNTKVQTIEFEYINK